MDVAAAIARAQVGDAVSRAIEFGADLSMTADSLTHSPTERLGRLRCEGDVPFGLKTFTSMDPIRIARLLAENHVEYVLVGGAAMAARGMNYATNDYDICYRVTSDNMQRLIDAVEPSNPKLRIESKGTTVSVHLDEYTLRETPILPLATEAGNVDLLNRVEGLGDYAAVLQHCTALQIAEHSVPVLSYAGLALAKRAAGRMKDLMALPELEALAEIERTSRPQPETPATDDDVE